MKRSCCCPSVWLVVGLLLIVVAIVIQLSIVPYMFSRNLEIRNGSMQYMNWYRPEVPIYMQWYIFNLTNVENVTDKSAIPRLEQLGPYTYRENRWKTDITWHDNGTVTYKNLKWWTFVPEMSNGTEEDLIYSVNLPLVTVAESLRYQSGLAQLLYSAFVAEFGETLFKNYTMHQLIWGYHDPMMIAARKLMPDWFYTDFVGVYAGKNYTDDGVWTVNTGKNNISKVGVTEAYNGSQTLNFWTSKQANMVNGSDGSIGQPNLSKDQQIQFFVPDVCRSLYAVYCEEEKTDEGITLYRYSTARTELLNATHNPDNAGFCTPAGNCLLGDGMMNLTVCQTLDRFNIPVIASLPHFLYGDPRYLAKVEGLHPVESEHRTDIAIEPRTGLVMRVAKRLQINMYIKPVEFISVLSGVEEMIFPVAWLNESAKITHKLEDTFLSTMQLLDAAYIICYVLYGCGGVMSLISSAFLIAYCCKKSGDKSGERQPLLSGSTSSDSASSSSSSSSTGAARGGDASGKSGDEERGKEDSGSDDEGETTPDRADTSVKT